MHAPDDTHDLAPVLLRTRVSGDSSSDRTLARPVLRRGHLVDDRDAKRIAGVAILEESTGHQAEVHRVEVAWRSGPPVRVREIGAARQDASFDLERPHVLHVAERELGDASRASDARQHGEAIEQLRVERHPLRSGRIPRQRK